MADPVVPPTNVRLECATWFVNHLRPAFVAKTLDVAVDHGHPGDALHRRHVWVDEITGRQEQPIMTAGRRKRDDLFRIPLEIRLLAPTPAEAFADLSAIVAVIEDVFAEAHTLDDEVPGILSAEIEEERTLVVRTPDSGHRGYGRVVLSIHARLG